MWPDWMTMRLLLSPGAASSPPTDPSSAAFFLIWRPNEGASMSPPPLSIPGAISMEALAISMGAPAIFIGVGAISTGAGREKMAAEAMDEDDEVC